MLHDYCTTLPEGGLGTRYRARKATASPSASPAVPSPAPLVAPLDPATHPHARFSNPAQIVYEAARNARMAELQRSIEARAESIASLKALINEVSSGSRDSELPYLYSKLIAEHQSEAAAAAAAMSFTTNTQPQPSPLPPPVSPLPGTPASPSPPMPSSPGTPSDTHSVLSMEEDTENNIEHETPHKPEVQLISEDEENSHTPESHDVEMEEPKEEPKSISEIQSPAQLENEDTKPTEKKPTVLIVISNDTKKEPEATPANDGQEQKSSVQEKTEEPEEPKEPKEPEHVEEKTPASTLFLHGMDAHTMGVLLRIWRMTVKQSEARVFRVPVGSEAPTYDAIVRERMDLSSLRLLLLQGVIKSAAEFWRYAVLMFTNAMIFNPPNSEVHHNAIMLKHYMEEQFRQSDIAGFLTRHLTDSEEVKKKDKKEDSSKEEEVEKEPESSDSEQKDSDKKESLTKEEHSKDLKKPKKKSKSKYLSKKRS